MKNKLMASALVLGFTIAPASAFADSVTTIQGGTPVYSCPQGQTLEVDKCITPASSNTTTETTQGTTQEQSVVVGYHQYNCTTYMDPWALNYYGASNIDYMPNDANCPVPYKNWRVAIKEVQTVTICPEGYDLNATNCSRQVTTPIPSSTAPATISGSNGGSLIASVTGFLTPVWNFLTNKLLPAIAALVVLGIGVRLSIKAVRKFSKVA